ncbi:hypothetical protein [Blastococcus sp. SYSU D00820]
MRQEQWVGLALAVMGLVLVLLAPRLVWEHHPDNPVAQQRTGVAGVWSAKRRAFHLWRGRIAGGAFVVVGVLLLTGVLFPAD